MKKFFLILLLLSLRFSIFAKAEILSTAKTKDEFDIRLEAIEDPAANFDFLVVLDSSKDSQEMFCWEYKDITKAFSKLKSLESNYVVEYFKTSKEVLADHRQSWRDESYDGFFDAKSKIMHYYISETKNEEIFQEKLLDFLNLLTM